MSFERPNLKIFFEDSRGLPHIKDESIDWLVGGSLHLGSEWYRYESLFFDVYVRNGLRVLKPEGLFTLIITDAYTEGEVFPRSSLALNLMLRSYRLIDVKVLKREQSSFFQVPFSMVYVFTKKGSKRTRTQLNKVPGYLPGLWDYPQKEGGELNAWGDGLCRLMLDAFSKPGDAILDPLCGTARVLSLGSKNGRVAVGYEIKKELLPVIEAAYNETKGVDRR